MARLPAKLEFIALLELICEDNDALLETEFKNGIPGRRFRFDWACPNLNLAFEYDGGGKGHETVLAIANDREKDTLAQLAGWKIFRFTPKMVQNGKAGELLRLIFGHAYGLANYRGN